MQYMYNGKNVTSESFKDTNSNSYPANWAKLATRAQRDAIGIVEISDPLPPILGADVPQSVAMRQARLALHQAGLLESIDAAIKNMGTEAIIEWEYTPTVSRDNRIVAMIQYSYNMTSTDIDNLFRLAALL